MSRGVLAAAAVALALVVLIAIVVAVDDGEGYRVRALFDTAAAAVPGEEVRVAGAKVGTIESLDVTEESKAVAVLAIDDERFTPFHADAHCTVRPQSLIGERYVECEPGTLSAAPLEQVDAGEGEGQHLLPLERTSAPVDLDLIQNIMRLPYRERFAILINELGAGLAGRGQDLREVVRRANPALEQTDRVLAVLASQNRVLARLASDSDAALAPLARERERVAGFINNANATATATAERRGDIEASIERLPGFLAQLRPLMADLGRFADQGAPVARDLRLAAPDLSRLIRQLGPFSTAATPSLVSLGEATVTGRPALIRTRPLIRDLASFAQQARPVSTNLDRLTRSFDETGGIERLADYLFYQALATNGFDGIGHYLRAGLIVNLCSLYAVQPAAGCSSNFGSGAASATTGGDALVARLAQRPGGRGSVPAGGGHAAADLAAALTPAGRDNVARVRERAQGASPALEDAGDPLLDYLLGEGP